MTTGTIPGEFRDIHILMGVLNGASALTAQLQSLQDQTWTNWRLTCGDDGSDDTSRDIIRDFGARVEQDVSVIQGPRQGFAANYMRMLSDLPADTGPVALADQDDIWFRDKLGRAVVALEACDAGAPALYCARRCIWWPDRGRMIPEAARDLSPGFRNALIENIASGHTIVLNTAAARLARAAAGLVPQVFAHDWWLYLLITGAGGHVIADPRPALLYRQHDQNAIGAGHGLHAQLTRKRAVLDGEFRQRLSENIAALQRCEGLLTPENRHVLAGFAQARNAPVASRLRRLGRMRPYRQSGFGSVAFWGAVLLGKV